LITFWTVPQVKKSIQLYIKCGNKGERDQWGLLTAVEKGERERKKLALAMAQCAVVSRKET